ncbi:glycosyl hydrolase family 18 protein [Paenibacillus sp. LHD-117]|uniref:glycosyl hydrolase family 18 protein n=1 Tax=Paenibacillus sp. LHD-117 TaxID=3071412 RepID=UPI0027E0EE8B|nr:glycosyl hydrolase family 18 protein [Paenibacillus sp. LHD-117]MDQ6421518.1 glycosyl hydrolase family 18 protein [Paenibacillus sp. LHD-117]
METNYIRSPRRKRRVGFMTLLFLFIVSAIATFAWFGYMKYIPSREFQHPSYAVSNPIMVNGVEAEHGALIENGEVKLPLPVLERLFAEDKPIHYESATGTIVLTSADKVLRLKTDALTGILNKQPYKLTIASEVTNDTVYIPVTPLEELYGLKVEYNTESGVVTLFKEGETVQLAEALPDNGTAIRTAPSIREPYLLKVPQGETVRVWQEVDGWLLVQSKQGHIGYVKQKEIKLTQTETVSIAERNEPFVPWKQGQKINLTWEAVYERKIDPTKIGEMPGVNVVSPTWFELTDGKGTIKGKADPAYVKWAHDRGYQVWALFSNGFEPDRTTEALATVESRFVMIQQLLAFAEMYKLQGFNIDFENVYTKDKENLVQFVKELTPLLHEAGLVVSIDVTPKSTSEMWSMFLDREALGRTVDYMMVMAYDEHWASSPKSGSVASLPWTERSITRILEEDNVPASKLILSMPLYARIWSEKAGADGKVEVTSKAVGMERVKQIIAEKKLVPVKDAASGQNYIEYSEEGVKQRIWIEDDLSMKARVELARKYDLAGVATWQRAFQTPSIWNTINETLTK